MCFSVLFVLKNLEESDYEYTVYSELERLNITTAGTQHITIRLSMHKVYT